MIQIVSFFRSSRSLSLVLLVHCVLRVCVRVRTRGRYHTLPVSKFSRRAKAKKRDEKGDLSRSLHSIPHLGLFAQERLKLLVLVSNPAGLDTVTRVSE